MGMKHVQLWHSSFNPNACSRNVMFFVVIPLHMCVTLLVVCEFKGRDQFTMTSDVCHFKCECEQSRQSDQIWGNNWNCNVNAASGFLKWLKKSSA